MATFPKYLPSPEQIEAEKRQIQSEWTEAEERSRRGATPDGQYEIPKTRFRSSSTSMKNARRAIFNEDPTR